MAKVELFFLERGRDLDPGRPAVRPCPVRSERAQAGADEPHGIWAECPWMATGRTRHHDLAAASPRAALGVDGGGTVTRSDKRYWLVLFLVGWAVVSAAAGFIVED